MSNRKVLTIDALQHQEWSRELFEDWRRGNVTAVSASLILWEGARTALDKIAEMYRLFEEHDDLIMQVKSSADIQTAMDSDKTGVILSFQNSSPYEEDLDLVALFKELGVNIVQLTYNNQNPVGGSCYEPNDSGLARFGHELVREMNRVGVLIDLSHVGERTSMDVIKASEMPVSITHANPLSLTRGVDLWQRNKSDEVIKALADAGGVIGLTNYPHLVEGGSDCTIDWFCDMVKTTVKKFGIDSVGLGSDFHHTLSTEFLVYSQTGTWTRELPTKPGVEYKPAYPEWAQTPADFPAVADAFAAHGLSDDEIEKIMGKNWLRLFEATF